MTTKKTVFWRIHYNSPVILSYALLSLAVLGLSLMTNGTTDERLFSVYSCSWLEPLGYIRLIGHTLGHINFEHYMGNFLLMMLIGPMLEEKYGSKRLLMMLVVTAVITGLAYRIFAPAGVAVLGASGMVFMLIVLSSFVNKQPGRLPLTLLFAVVFYLGTEFVYSATGAQPGVANTMHLLGGICGLIFGFVVRREE